MTYVADEHGRIRIDFQLGELVGHIHANGLDGQSFAPGEVVALPEARVQGILAQLLVPFQGVAVPITAGSDES